MLTINSTQYSLAYQVDANGISLIYYLSFQRLDSVDNCSIYYTLLDIVTDVKSYSINMNIRRPMDIIKKRSKQTLVKIVMKAVVIQKILIYCIVKIKCGSHFKLLQSTHILQDALRQSLTMHLFVLHHTNHILSLLYYIVLSSIFSSTSVSCCS